MTGDRVAQSVTGYRSGDQGLFLGRPRNFCLYHSMQAGSGVHMISYQTHV